MPTDQFLHFRGIPKFPMRDDPVEEKAPAKSRELEWLPLCSMRAEPRRGPVTLDRDLVTCPDCRRILRMPKAVTT